MNIGKYDHVGKGEEVKGGGRDKIKYPLKLKFSFSDMTSNLPACPWF